ncbi:hypothetical protein PHMEG_0006758 [Phytophthora megakarya]|uniref:PHD-type domain-containing protein n=1 Tax=Phytophthora megakarya TaxID=4795 RepID=A0A225WN25_9STRA|nr:hypothetical protein PHMEG_0006758 [Phytophthora megakarya]
MVLITNWLGVEVASSKESPGIFLLARDAHNPAILEALDRGVIQNGDEVFAFNDHVLRNTDLRAFKEKVVPSTSLPLRCWFRTKRKSKAFAVSSQVAFTQGDLGAVSLGINWPWVFLRSDGKLAMNVFWKSLDSAFFLRKINRRTFSQLQDKVEEMCSVRLSSSHPDYEKYCELLVLPRRERVPRFIVEFRKSREQKQKFLSSDVLVGVSSETKDSETEIDEQTPLEVGTTVNVAKRTWPGMNKLGGVGRIKKVNEVKVTNSEKRFTYNIAYILSGNDKNVERKYISVVDLDTEGSDKNEEMSSTSTGRRQKFEPEADNKGFQEPDSDRISVRVVFTANRTTDEDQLAVLRNTEIGSEPKHRRFQLQFTTANSAVHCERKSKHHGDDIPAKELLMHRHFPIKAPDALVNTCFSSELLSIEDRIGDEVDDDNTDSEDESDEIKSELITLQRQFRVVMESNETVFASLTKKVKDEYASKECRLQDLQEIQWRNYERMYQELETAKRQFDDSDEESDAGNDAHLPGSGTNAESEKGEDSDVEDISFGGMFVNKLKQEGNEVCALCELSGGDFTRTDTEKFVHPQCAMFTPETFFKDGVVHGIDLVDPERRRLKCSICGGRKGLSKIQCTHRKCVRAFHVACAFVNGLLTRDPYYQAWCARHLKTSGMGQFVELPDHLKKDKSAPSTVIIKSDTPTTTPASSPARRNRKNNKQQSSQQKRGRARKDTTPAEPSAKAHSDISSKTNRKRKRKGSTSIPNTRSPKNIRGTRGSSPRCAIVIESEEPRCARRLEIELSDDSDHEGKAVEAWQQGRNPQHVFIEKDVVEVLARDWRGSNKPGGVARVRSVEVVENKTGGKDVFYDIVHVVGAFKEKRVPAKYIRKYSESNDESKT